jgi:subtilisin family serine protease/flagellar basal body-associated protein FliL
MPGKSTPDTKPLGVTKLERKFSSTRLLILLAIISLLFLVIAAVGAWFYLKAHPDGSEQPFQLSPPLSLSELVEDYPELSTILQDTKLDSVYKEFLIAYEEGGEMAAFDLARKRGLLSDDDELRLTLELNTTDTDDLQAEFESIGVKVTAVSRNMMDIAIPLGLLKESLQSERPGSLFLSISGLENIIRIRMPMMSIKDVGSVYLESLAMIGAESWQSEGYTGAGVKVAILDGGFDGYQYLLGDDLPADLIVKSFIAGTAADATGSVHGTACAEIVHDIAPSAKLYLVASDTETETNQAVSWLIEQGVDIITHSASWLYGPKDGTGPGTYAVRQAVSNGIFWVNSAGNYAETHYRAIFTDYDGDGFHEFSDGDEMLAFEPGGVVKFVLNWDDWDIGDQNLDLFVVDSYKNEIASSQNFQSGPGDAMEYISYQFSDSGPYSIAFYGANVTRQVLLDFFIYNGEIEYYTKEYSLGSPADAAEAFTIGATYWENDSLEPFSSQGPTNDGRFKPDLSAPDGTNSAAYGEAFYGTSASTPHVAGVAALILEAYPDYSPQDVGNFLKSNAIDLGNPGPDYLFGYGRLNIGLPPDIGVLPTPPVIATTVDPSPTTPPTQVVPPSEVPTQAATITSEASPTATPEPEDKEGSNSLLFSFIACVLLPGIIGLSGIGILGVVLLSRRSRKSRQYSQSTPRYAPVSYPSISPPPDYSSKSENICPRCGASLREGARFCSYCGYTLELGTPDVQFKAHCIYCGQSVRPNSKFCNHCGKRV